MKTDIPSDYQPRRDGPIGVFDSGVGGLSILQGILKALPNEDLIYVADSIHVPYGKRPPEEVRDLSLGISRYLLSEGAKAIVVACNTASAMALQHLRLSFLHVPFIGMVPAVKPAAEQTRSGVVGVLATPNTLEGELYHEVVECFAHGARVLSATCDGLVECVESGDLDGQQVHEILHRCIDPLVAQGADVLVLGCTHYPFVMEAIRQVAGPGVAVIEPSEAIARRVGNVLHQQGLDRVPDHAGQTLWTTTGDPARFAWQRDQLIGQRGAVYPLRWEAGALGRLSEPGWHTALSSLGLADAAK
jgi:glutamate racemase